MSNKDVMIRVNQSLEEIRQSNKSGSHVNCIRLNASCSDVHNAEIIARCLEYLKLGVPFMTEAIFHNGQRCDIINLSTQEIHEIMVSESESRFAAKIYPELFKITKVRI